jgi:succinate dehydrogenase / fumarate reductase flavoprotein subunit
VRRFNRLVEVSANIIDQCFRESLAREYGGLLDNRLFEVRLFLEPFMQRSNTTIALGAYSAMNRQIGRGKIKMHHRHEMLDLVIVDGKARGIIARNCYW